MGVGVDTRGDVMAKVGTSEPVLQWQTARLTGSLGGEVVGADINSFGETEADSVIDLLVEHHVLVFRGQTLDNDGLARFGEMFGELNKFAYKDHVADRRGAVSDLRNDAMHAITDKWHSDAPTYEQPPTITILVARKLPDAGGDTLYSNQHTAFDSFSEGFKDVLRPLRAVHFLDYGPDGTKTQMHPVVRVHPITRREALYVNPITVTHLEGLTEEESRPILTMLFDHASRPEFGYRHRWQNGDVVMWDNRSVMHRATHDYGTDPDSRMMNNVQTACEPVYGPGSLIDFKWVRHPAG